MSAPTTPPLDYYGKYLFAHSLTYCRWSRLTAKDIHTALHQRAGFEGQDIWFYLNHPIKWVRIVGIVVAYDELENRRVLTVDDGSGYTIDLISWTSAPLGTDPEKYKPANLDGVGLRSMVKVKGSVSEFRGTRQVLLKRVKLLKDTNEEVTAWGETTEFKREILSKPWVVRAEVVEREKRRIEGEVEDEERLRERKRRKLEKQKKPKEEGRGKENIPWEQFDQEQGEDGNGFEENQGIQEDTTYIGRRRPPNAKQPPPTPLLPEPPEPEITDSVSTSTFRGRRRTTPAPTAAILIQAPPEPEPEPEPEPGSESEAVPVPTYRGRRRTSKPPTGVSSSILSSILPPLPESDPIEIPIYHEHQRTPRLPTISPPPEDPIVETSSYYGRRRASKPRDVFTPSLIPDELLDSVQFSSAESSTYPESWKTPRDGLTPIPDPSSEELLKPAQPPIKSTYRGRRRASRAPREGSSQASLGDTSTFSSQGRLQELVSTLLPQSSGQCTSYRELQRLLKSQRNSAETQEISEKFRAPPTGDEDSQLGVGKTGGAQGRSSRASETPYGRRRRPKTPDIQATLQSPIPSVISTYIPSQSQVSEKEIRSSYRGKRRERQMGPSTPDVWATLHSPMPSAISTYIPSSQPQSSENEGGGSYRRKRRGESQVELSTQELLDFSDFVPTPVSQSTIMGDSYWGTQKVSGSQRQTGTQEFLETLEFSDFVPSPSQSSVVVGSSFRGRRRGQQAGGTPYSPYSPGAPPSGNPSQVASSGSSYRGKRRG